MELADCRGDPASHVAGLVCLLEHLLLRLAAEVDVGDAVGPSVAADAVPLVAAVGAGPCLEDIKLSFVEGCLELQQRRPLRRRT